VGTFSETQCTITTTTATTYYIRLTAFFQDNQGKPPPER